MSDYRTYVFLGKDYFSIGDLKDVNFTTDADLESMQYTIKAKCALDTPLRQVLNLMNMGMDFTITFGEGKKYKLQLVPVD